MPWTSLQKKEVAEGQRTRDNSWYMKVNQNDIWWNLHKDMRQGPKEQMCQQEGWSGTIWDFSVKIMDFDTYITII